VIEEKRHGNGRRNDDAPCPLDAREAAELLAAVRGQASSIAEMRIENKEQAQMILSMNTALQLFMQRQDLRTKEIEKRQDEIEKTQKCILSELSKYKKYFFAGTTVFFVLAAIGSAFLWIYEHSIELSETIRKFIFSGNEK